MGTLILVSVANNQISRYEEGT